MPRRSRQAALLLDVLLALGLLVAGAISILTLLRTGASGLARVRDLDHAAGLARSAIALIEAGIETPESLHGPVRESSSDENSLPNDEDDLDADRLILHIDSSPSAFDGLTIITVRVLDSAQESEDRTLFELRQLVALRPRGQARPRPRKPLGVRPRPRPRDRSNGFTLLETVLALALIAMLLGSMMTFLWRVLGDRSILSDHARKARLASAAIDRLEADVSMAVAGHGRHGRGFSGTSTSLELLTRGVVLAGTLAEAQEWSSDLQWASWWFGEEAQEIRYARAHEPGSKGEATHETMVSGVGVWRLQYAVNSRWADRFESQTNQGLPDALEVTIWLGDVGTEDAAPPNQSRRAWPARSPDLRRVIAVPMLAGDRPKALARFGGEVNSSAEPGT
jgi:type II secretory pathway component PulJ